MLAVPKGGDWGRTHLVIHFVVVLKVTVLARQEVDVNMRHRLPRLVEDAKKEARQSQGAAGGGRRKRRRAEVRFRPAGSARLRAVLYCESEARALEVRFYPWADPLRERLSGA